MEAAARRLSCAQLTRRRGFDVWFAAVCASAAAGPGLKYQDLIVETPEVQKALSRLPEDVIVARDRRFKRALDISFKRKPLPEEHQEKIDVFDVRAARVGLGMRDCSLLTRTRELCCGDGNSSTWRRR